MDRTLFMAHAKVEHRHWWFVGRRQILQSLVHRVAPAGEGAALVDVGCGTGGNAAAFADEYNVLGVDPSADAITLAREHHPTVQFRQTATLAGVAAHLAHGGVLLMTDVLEHVADSQALFDSALATVPSGGTLLLTVPADPGLWSPHDQAFGHMRRYTIASFRALWQGAPVVERLLSPFNSRLYPAISVIRALRRRSATSGSDLSVPAGPLNNALRGIFAGESQALVAAVDSGQAAYRRGVSLVALLRRI